MYRIIMICLMIVLGSCSKPQQKNEELSALFPVVADPMLDDENYLPALAGSFDVNLFLANFSSSDTDKINSAIEIIKLVIATQDFKNQVLNYTYNGKRQFVDNGGYTNEQIYQRILEGAEELKPIKNNTLDADLELYYENSNTVGYTNPSTTRIWINTLYFNSYTGAGVAHNLMHEWMHKLGFEHAVNWDPSRDSSVPYAIGYIVQDIGNNFL